VATSLQNLFARLKDEGYNLGDPRPLNGDSVIKALRILSQEINSVRGSAHCQSLIDKENLAGYPMRVVNYQVSYSELKSWLGKQMTLNMEKQWGDLDAYTGIGAGDSRGTFQVMGLQFGNVFVGIQPILGIEGDPMRLLFERDLTPHPQYAAFYLWLQKVYQPNCIVHFGMHGTVEW
jgi:magnesium chelatase subunit H